MREAGEQRVGGDRAVPARDRGRAARQATLAHRVEGVLAQDRAPDDAVTADATAGSEVQHDALPRRDAGDTGSYGLDDARPLVAEHGRERKPPLAVGLPDVGVADSCRDDADEDLAGAGLTQGHLFDPMGLAKGVQNGCLRLH